VGRNRFVRGQDERRGRCRAVLLFFALLAILTAGCGKSGQGAETNPEKGSDAELLNAALAQELTLLHAYTEAPPLLDASFRAVGRQLRAHEQEYVNAITKALRGLGGDTEAEPDQLDLAKIMSKDEFLTLIYRLENTVFASYLDVAPQLFTDAPRTLAASLAAAHAQHLVALRPGLGATSVEAIPEAFESGEEPPPRTGR
jgi:hypothetical protein